MRYILLIYEVEQNWVAMNEAEKSVAMEKWTAVAVAMREKGILEKGDALPPTTTATSLRVAGGKSLITNGPFAETREQLGGYFIVNVANADEAMAWARKLPITEGTIEARPLE